jgi:hypothetical protein
MKNRGKWIWGILGAGAVVLTTIGFYYYVRSIQKKPKNAKVEMVEAIIHEVEELLRQQRSSAKKSLS